MYTYDSFLKAIAKFPYFCGENGHIGNYFINDLDSCKREVAALLAHIVQETGGREARGQGM